LTVIVENEIRGGLDSGKPRKAQGPRFTTIKNGEAPNVF